MPRRADVLFLAWTTRTGRHEDLAADLGGSVVAVTSGLPAGRRWAPARYVVCAARTAVLLVRRRPRTVVVTNPPVFAALTVAVVAPVVRARTVLDSHPVAFGAKGATVWRSLEVLHRWVVRRAHAVLVTTESWAEQVGAWGGHGVVVHEAPPATGAPRGEEVERAADRPRFAWAMVQADAVLALTTEPTSVMRVAYEAVYLERPLLVSGTAVNRELFPCAVVVDVTPESIAAGLRSTVLALGSLRSAARHAREVQVERWANQRQVLALLLRGNVGARAEARP